MMCLDKQVLAYDVLRLNGSLKLQMFGPHTVG